MRGIDLKIGDVIKHLPPQEQGMIVAERAVKSTVMYLLSDGDNSASTKEEGQRYLEDEFPEFRELAKTTLLDCCLPKYPEIYKKADRWLTDNLIEAWKEEYIVYYFSERCCQ